MNTTRLLDPTTPCVRALVRRRRWLTVLTAMATATAAAAIADPIGGVDLVVRAGDGTRTIEPFVVMLTTLAIGLAGWGLLELLERWSGHARALWLAVAGVVFVVSLAGPLGALTGAATAVLLGLHVLVAAILVVGVGGFGRAEDTR
jgi:hypothetical protein